MKTRQRTAALCFAVAAIFAAGCKNDEIKTYQVENSAVNFTATSYQFSLKGMTTPTDTLKVDINLVGPATDYDRTVSIKASSDTSDPTAVSGKDFTLLETSIKAGMLSGTVMLVVNELPEGTDKLGTVLSIEPNENFREGFPSYQRTVVTWSEEYVRPTQYVWKYWYTYICHGYSRNFHELIVKEFGEEMEHYTCSSVAANNDTTLTYKSPYWWYAATREFRQMVKDHDTADPEHPYMHSDDFQSYSDWQIAWGEGTKPETTPTILETLVVL